MLDIFFFKEMGVSRIRRMQRWKGLLSVVSAPPVQGLDDPLACAVKESEGTEPWESKLTPLVGIV